MSENPYLDALDAEEQRLRSADATAAAPAAVPTPESNPYLAALNDEEATRRTQVRANLVEAVRTNPEQVAEARQLGKRTGVPDEVIIRNLQDVKLRDAVERAADRIGTSPRLEAKMQEKVFAMMAHDDVPNLADLEERIAKYGELKASTGPKPSLGNVISGLFKSLGQGAEASRQGIRMQFADAIGSDDMARDAQRKAAAVQTDVVLSTPDFESATARGLYGGGTSLIRQIPGLAASIATRSTAPMLATAGLQTESEAYTKYRARGATPGQALLGATGEGAVEVATEVLPMGFVVERFGKAGAGEFLKGLLGREVPSEQVATFVQDAIDTAVANPDKSWEDFLRERPEAAYQTLLATLVQSGTIGGLNAAATKLQDRAQKVQASQQQAEAVASVMEAARNSKLRERDPETFAAHAQKVADDAGASEVFVDARTFAQSLAQLPPAEQEKIAAAMPSIGEQLADAVETGGDLAIPVGELTTLAGGPLEQSVLPLVRTDPAAWSPAEAEAYGKEQAELVKQEAEQLAAESVAQVEAAQQAQAVREQVLGQLQTAKRFTEDVNGAYADLVRDFYSTQAQRLGTTPDQLFAQYPLRIVAESPAEAGKVLNQLVTFETGASDFIAAKTEAGMVGGHVRDGALRITHAEVAEQMRGKGEGVKLYAALIDKALGEGLQVFSDSTVEAPAVRVYEALKRRGYDVRRLEGGEIDGAVFGKGAKEPAFQVVAGPQPLAQGDVTARGTFNPDTRTIALLRGADLSTFLHELGHFQLEMLAELASQPNAPVQIQQDMQALLDWFGFKAETPADLSQSKAIDASGRPILVFHGTDKAFDEFRDGMFTSNRERAENYATGSKGRVVEGYLDIRNPMPWADAFGKTPQEIEAAGFDGAIQWGTDGGIMRAVVVRPDQVKKPTLPPAVQWRAQSLDERREAHEQFARGFEAYLFEGKAPSVELQGLFQRFRAWLVQVYRSLSALRVELSDEVRGVMNRLIATDEQIATAEAAQAYMPMFETAEAAGMTPEQFAAYQQLGAGATAAAVEELQKRSLKDMRWLSNAKGRKLREMQRDVAAKRKAVEAEVRAEIDGSPIEQARRYLREQAATDPAVKAEIKAWEALRDAQMAALRETVKAEYLASPEGAETKGIKKGQFLAKNKRAIENEAERRLLAWERENPKPAKPKNEKDFDYAAELFGFTSGDHLQKALAAEPPRAEKIEGLTDQRMLERYGDLTNTETLERAAEAAIHNDARGRFVASELRALDRSVNVRAGSVSVYARAAKRFAEQSIAARKIRDIRPAQFTAAEARAGRQAEKALRGGDLAGATAAKRNQLLNHHSARAATAALDEVDKALDYLKKFSSEGTRKGLDSEYTDQIDALLERYDLRTGQSLTAIDKRKSLAQWVEAQRELGFEPAIDESLLQAAGRTHYRDLPLEQFRGLVDTVRNIEHLGRLKKKLLTAKDEREFAAAVADAEASIRANARSVRSGKYGDQGALSAAGEMFRGVLAMHRKFASTVREMDGFKDGGALWELFVRPMNEAGDREAAMREQATIELTKVFEPITKQRLTRKEYIPEINDSLTKEQMLSVALNWGNEANRARVMQGDGWNEQQVGAILDRLEESDWRFVQAVWDHIDSYWPAISAKEKRLTGTAPEKVEAVPVQTKFGEFKGGYYPIKYDPSKSTKAEADTAAEVAKQMMGGAYTRATTRRGHTKARVDEVRGRPIRKDFGVVFEHINQVAHDVAWHEWLIDAQRLLRAKPIDAAVREHYGPETLRELRKAMEDIAAGDVPAQDHLERAMNHLRVGTTIAGLGYNLMTSLLQPLGLTQSMVRIGPKWVAKGLGRWLGGAARMENVATEIYEKSNFMRLRAKTQQRELNEILNVVKGKRLTKLEASYFWLIQTGQKVADIPTWLGAYEKASAEGNDEARAVALADQAVLDAQGGGQIKDLSRVQRGGVWMKLFTNFYSFFNVLYNMSAESVNRTNFRDPASIARLMGDYLLLYTVPAAMATLMKAALTGGEDDEEKLMRQLAADQLTYLAGTMVGLREISAGIQGATGVYSSYTGPAGVRFFAEVAKLGKQAQQGEADEAFLKALNNTAGILFHYPAGQVNRTVEGAAAMIEGETANPFALVVGPPKD